MVERRARDRRRDEVAVREVAVVEPLAAVHDGAVAAERAHLRDRVLVARDGGGIDHRAHPVLAPRRIAGRRPSSAAWCNAATTSAKRVCST